MSGRAPNVPARQEMTRDIDQFETWTRGGHGNAIGACGLRKTHQWRCRRKLDHVSWTLSSNAYQCLRFEMLKNMTTTMKWYR